MQTNRVDVIKNSWDPRVRGEKKNNFSPLSGQTNVPFRGKKGAAKVSN